MSSRQLLVSNEWISPILFLLLTDFDLKVICPRLGTYFPPPELQKVRSISPPTAGRRSVPLPSVSILPQRRWSSFGAHTISRSPRQRFGTRGGFPLRLRGWESSQGAGRAIRPMPGCQQSWAREHTAPASSLFTHRLCLHTLLLKSMAPEGTFASTLLSQSTLGIKRLIRTN